MEPTIYKPSIYKGAGIYKAGGAGGGGESWRDWYDELERLGYKSTNKDEEIKSWTAQI